jgi:hypothetical protein
MKNNSLLAAKCFLALVFCCLLSSCGPGIGGTGTGASVAGSDTPSQVAAPADPNGPAPIKPDPSGTPVTVNTSVDPRLIEKNWLGNFVPTFTTPPTRVTITKSYIAIEQNGFVFCGPTPSNLRVQELIVSGQLTNKQTGFVVQSQLNLGMGTQPDGQLISLGFNVQDQSGNIIFTGLVKSDPNSPTLPGC